MYHILRCQNLKHFIITGVVKPLKNDLAPIYFYILHRNSPATFFPHKVNETSYLILTCYSETAKHKLHCPKSE